ncbi:MULTISPECIES: DUF2946 family protein [unclassified Bradyrhizobium]|uniref:DUF2946 family protein n=1 Tax=unclassified Bradyrhizobium TaxID=2631580 RepID=UPI0028E49735|nr:MULTISPECIES: DUF2946 family protein [unclassified Bradyrhizobium]
MRSARRRAALSRLGGALVWFAAWALIFQSALALSAMSAAVAAPDTVAIICQSSTDGPSSDDIGTAAKQCASCPFCALGRGVAVPHVPTVARPMPVVVAILIERIDVVAALRPALELPVARGPPAAV